MQKDSEYIIYLERNNIAVSQDSGNNESAFTIGDFNILAVDGSGVVVDFDTDTHRLLRTHGLHLEMNNIGDASFGIMAVIFFLTFPANGKPGL